MAFSEKGYSMQAAATQEDVSINNSQQRRENSITRDEDAIARFGKKQQLRRNFGLLSMVGLTCTLMITWEGTLSAFQSGLSNGGPSGLTYGFLFTWIGTGLQTLVMAEMASMIPLAGGQYNWVAILAPKPFSKFLSYLTGWITVIAWQAGLASCAFVGGTMTQGLLVLNYESYVFERWHGTLLFYAIILLSLFINTFLARLLPKIEAAMLLIHAAGFFCILIPMVYLASHGTAKDVFATFSDGGDWSSSGVAFFVGLSTSMFAFIGIDAASHMAEEIEEAATVIPKSMITSVALNGVLGCAIVIATLFCLGDENNAINSSTGYPIIEVFINATGSNAAANAMTSVLIAAFIFAAVGGLTTASRMAWAFARERGLPGSSVLARVDQRTSLPLYTIALSTLTSLLLALINIGSSKAFNALTSLVIAAFYSSFVVSAACFLHKQLTTPKAEIPYGPFTLGKASLPVIVLAIIFSVIGIFFSFWPTVSQVSAPTMNWSVVVFGGALTFSLLFWAVHGRKVYTGPLIEL